MNFKPGATFNYVQRADGQYLTFEQTWTTDKSEAFRFIGERDATKIIRSFKRHEGLDCKLVPA